MAADAAPMQSFCGCLALPTSVLVAFVECLVRCTLFFSTLSSKDTFNIGSLEISTEVQVGLGTYALIGVFIAVLAGFGSLFRMERWVYLFFQYMAVMFVLDLACIMKLLLSADLCQAVTHPIILGRGPIFVCLIIDSGIWFWSLLYVGFQAYLVIAVWSQAEALRSAEVEALMAYESMVPRFSAPVKV
mmetsp:Transcript_3910/g.11310  ORF Transcript_3910/g.11310 Transcript_3910/m.11310 type:complete len:188 (-) Transcript_3910:45-608(-)